MNFTRPGEHFLSVFVCLTHWLTPVVLLGFTPGFKHKPLCIRASSSPSFLSLSQQSSLTKFAESLQEMINYHTVCPQSEARLYKSGGPVGRGGGLFAAYSLLERQSQERKWVHEKACHWYERRKQKQSKKHLFRIRKEP